jgi:hypothetical protein
MLQGYYRYDVSNEDSNTPLFGGYAAIYIQDNELHLTGWRIYSEIEGEQIPLFWRSIFTRFIDNIDGKTELYFPYHTFEVENSGDGNVARVRRADLDTIEDTVIRTGIADVNQPLNIYQVISNLASGPPEVKIKPALRGLCTLEIPYRRDDQRGDNLTWDLVLNGGNYGLLVGFPIRSSTVYKRLTRSSLENIERSAEQGS